MCRMTPLQHTFRFEDTMVVLDVPLRLLFVLTLVAMMNSTSANPTFSKYLSTAGFHARVKPDILVLASGLPVKSLSVRTAMNQIRPPA